MRIRTLGVLLVAMLALTTSSGASSSVRTVLGARWISGGSELQRYNASTLRRVGPTLTLRMPAHPWARSPGGATLALARSFNQYFVADLLLVDLRGLRRIGSMSAGVHQVTALAWTRPDRLLAVGVTASAVELSLVDLTRRRVVRRARVPGTLVRADRRAAGFVLLLAPSGAIGPSRLVVVDADMHTREISLARIASGSERVTSGGPNGEPPTTRMRQPALALDGSARHAFILGVEGDPVADVDLVSGAVIYRPLVLRRPTVPSKIAFGTMLSARRVAPATLAVWGVAYDGLDETTRFLRQTPVGLWLVDTETWAPRLLDPETTAVSVAGPWLLPRNAGAGLEWWDARTAVRRSAFDQVHVSELAVLGDLALVRLDGEPNSRLLDLRSGKVLGMRLDSPPQFLVGRGSLAY